jgi:Na+/H+ antiporter NhaD/arsenite permease-like protein
MPSALPSKEMLERSSFVKKAVEKPWYTYLQTLRKISPLHCCGLLFVILLCAFLFYSTTTTKKKKEESLSKEGNAKEEEEEKDINRRTMAEFVVFASLPIGFIGLVTFLGLLGGGYQNRFILPALPFTSLLSAIAFQYLTNISEGKITFPLLLGYSAMLFFYYCNLYSIYYADLEYSLIDILLQIISHPYQTNNISHDFIQMLQHFGYIK